jgi:hypothetical protein
LEFADRNGLVIELVDYPPYHSKYNSVERGWGILEPHWNGAILNSREAVLSWAQTMTWVRFDRSSTVPWPGVIMPTPSWCAHLLLKARPDAGMGLFAP